MAKLSDLGFRDKSVRARGSSRIYWSQVPKYFLAHVRVMLSIHTCSNTVVSLLYLKYVWKDLAIYDTWTSGLGINDLKIMQADPSPQSWYISIRWHHWELSTICNMPDDKWARKNACGTLVANDAHCTVPQTSSSFRHWSPHPVFLCLWADVALAPLLPAHHAPQSALQSRSSSIAISTSSKQRTALLARLWEPRARASWMLRSSRDFDSR
jgi:hypothetical protein